MGCKTEPFTRRINGAVTSKYARHAAEVAKTFAESKAYWCLFDHKDELRLRLVLAEVALKLSDAAKLGAEFFQPINSP